jgi:hypothetical protein
MECPCCGNPAPGLQESRVQAFHRARLVCKRLSHWWKVAKPVIQSGEAAHDLAGIVLLARAVLDLDVPPR